MYKFIRTEDGRAINSTSIIMLSIEQFHEVVAEDGENKLKTSWVLFVHIRDWSPIRLCKYDTKDKAEGGMAQIIRSLDLYS